MAGYCRSYTNGEETKILQFIIKKRAYYKLRGIGFWKEMEESGDLDRTYQSLKEHFRKQMVFRLHKNYYEDVPEDELRKIKRGFEDSAVGQNLRRAKEKEGGRKKEVDLSVTPPSSNSSTDENA